MKLLIVRGATLDLFDHIALQQLLQNHQHPAGLTARLVDDSSRQRFRDLTNA